MKTEQARDFLKDNLKGKCEAYDFSILENQGNSLEVFEGKIKKSNSSSCVQTGIRVLKNGRPGYASTERMSKESLELMIKDAINHTELSDTVDFELPKIEPVPDIDLKKFNPELETLSMEEMKGFCLDLESDVIGKKNILNIPYLGMAKSKSKRIFCNSNNLIYENKSNRVSAHIGASAKKGDVTKMGMYFNSSKVFDDLNVNTFSTKVIDRANELLDAKPVEAGVYPVVFSNRVSDNIIGMFASIFSADNIQKGQSKLKGKVGQKIASEIFSLRCDPHLKDGQNSRIYDGEGVVCNPMQIIENGKLCNVIHNLETAKKDGVKPTGHGVRGLSSRAGVSFSNMVVDKGNDSFSELLNLKEKCLHVVKLEGGAACSSISGEISIGIQGFLYENGKKVQAVDRVIINSNIFELFKNIVAFSNEYSEIPSSIMVPDFLVDNIKVSS